MAGYHCSNCRENIANLKKVSIGEDRNVVFCGACNCYVTIEEPRVAAKKPAASASTDPK
jgi:transcription elongation factor Elf1